MTPIEVEEEDSGWSISVGDALVLWSSCYHIVKKFAEALTRARNCSTHRGAMQILIEELGCCEKYASALFLNLQGGDSRDSRPN